VVVAIIVLLAVTSSLAVDATAQTGKTYTIRHDRDGRTDPKQVPSNVLAELRKGDKLAVEFYPTEVFDLAATDLPRRDAMKAIVGRDPDVVFIYPLNPYLTVAKPLELIPNLEPGVTDLYAVGTSASRLRLTYLNETEFNEGAPKDPGQYKVLLKTLGHSCSTPGDRPLVGTAEPAPTLALEKRVVDLMGWAGAENRPSLYVFRHIPIRGDTTPYLRIEVVSLEGGRGCTPPTDSLVARTKEVVFVRLGHRFQVPELKWRVGVKSDSMPMEQIDPSRPVFMTTTAALDEGTYEYQVCYSLLPDADLKRRFPQMDRYCVPVPPVTVTVGSELPSNVRFQPGIMVVNRFRDVRLTLGMTFILDRASYFRRRKTTRFLGGVLNPAVGLQAGGSENQIVLLLGGHLRMLEQAGMVFGLRFGNETSSTPYRLDRNFYVGVSLDPPLFGKIHGAGND
jgi:hypothetical protein